MAHSNSGYKKLNRFQPAKDDPNYEEHVLIEGYEKHVLSKTDGYFRDIPLKDTEAGTKILAYSADNMVELVLSVLRRLEYTRNDFAEICENPPTIGYVVGSPLYIARASLYYLLNTTLRRKLPFNTKQILELLKLVDEQLSDNRVYFHYFPYGGVAKSLQDYCTNHECDKRFDSVLRRIGKKGMIHQNRDIRKHVEKMLKLAGLTPKIPIRPGEAWSDAAIHHIDEQTGDVADSWSALVAHCAKATGGKPTKKWSKIAAELVTAVGRTSFCKSVSNWFLLVDKPRTHVIESWSEYEPNPNLMIDQDNADILKGLVWCTGTMKFSEPLDAIGKLAFSAYKKVPGVGPRASKIGNACVWALGQVDSDSALAALAILKVRVKFKPAQKGIAAALATTAERLGMTPDELEELGVPDYGMQEVGRREESFGDYTGVLEITSSTRTALTWTSPAGKPLKSVPKIVRDEHTEQLKDLRGAAKDITKMLSAQRERMDNLFLSQRTWNYTDWLERYINHRLNGTLGRRLIWTVEQNNTVQSGIWWQDTLVDSKGNAMSCSPNASVKLWHPAIVDTEQVTSWRNWLETNQVTQPFKQAHREIYLLTDAEKNTDTYSNRYASHIVKQHQFNALCALRRWNNTLRLMVDDDYDPPTRVLPGWGVRAEFWVEGAGDDYGTDTTEAGSYLYLATDQVRFYSTEAATNWAHAGGGGYTTQGTELEVNSPLKLDSIDPLVFSEIMRDVDLFVGVASVGNDPNWSDGGPEGRYIDYWNSYSFGELSESAKSRKQLLERLIPRLKIKDQCVLDDRFLKVKGDIRTYKIHLGSGNILMEPNDQYLCIVASQSKSRQADSVFLPFEGDSRLAVILSKAFLLAEDTKIKDSTIISQIKPN